MPELPDIPDLLPSKRENRYRDDVDEIPEYESSEYDGTYWNPLEGVEWTPIKYRYRREERESQVIRSEKNREKISHENRHPHPSFGVSELLDQDYIAEDVNYFSDADLKVANDTDAKLLNESHFTHFFPPTRSVTANDENLSACKVIPNVAFPENQTLTLSHAQYGNSPFHNTDMKANRLRANITKVTTDDTNYEPETPDAEKNGISLTPITKSQD